MMKLLANVSIPNSRGCLQFIVTLLPGMVLMATAPVVAQDPDLQHGPLECPAYEDLNRTTLHYLKNVEQRAFSDPDFIAKRTGAGLAAEYTLDQIRVLTTARDSTVCQKFNEHYDRIRPLSGAVLDRSTGRYVPRMYAMYYQVGEYYVVIYDSYEGGSEDPDEIGPPSGGWVTVGVFEPDNLRVVGHFQI